MKATPEVLYHLLMETQIIFVLLFALNLLLMWLAVFNRKFFWYQFVGYILFILIPLGMIMPEQPHFALDYSWWVVAGAFAIAFGLGLNFWARREFKKAGGQWYDFSPPGLLTSGPYRFFRHPQYLGLMMVFVGWWWIWAAAYAFYFGMFILALVWLEGYLEEKIILEKRFGDQYKEYRRETGMFWIK